MRYISVVVQFLEFRFKKREIIENVLLIVE